LDVVSRMDVRFNSRLDGIAGGGRTGPVGGQIEAARPKK